MAGISESNLIKLWRTAVLIEFNNKCAICYHSEGLECHHFIRRKVLILRYDWRNGIALCPECHKKAHTKEGDYLIQNILAPKLKYLFEKERGTIKDHCIKSGKSKNAILKEIHNDLMLKIKG